MKNELRELRDFQNVISKRFEQLTTNLKVFNELESNKYTFIDAENYLKQAQKDLNTFNKLPDSDLLTKNSILAIGTYNAYLASGSFKTILLNSIKDLKEQGKDFELDFDDSQYKKLYYELFAIIIDHVSSLKVWSSINRDYDRNNAKKQSDYEKDWKDVAIRDVGLKVYHLKMMIDYSEKLKANIARIHFADDKHTDLINEYVLKGNNSHIRLSMYLSKDIPEDPTKWDSMIELNLCKYCINVFDYYFSAFLLINKFEPEKIEGLTFDEKLAKVLECKDQKSSINIINSYYEPIINMSAMVQLNGRNNFLKSSYLKSLIEGSLDVITNFRFELDKNTIEKV